MIGYGKSIWEDAMGEKTSNLTLRLPPEVHQKLKVMAMSQPEDVGSEVVRKGAIMGALNLYLDFINMFLFLLSIFGDRD